MSDEATPDGTTADALAPAIAALLARPDTWEEPPDLGDSIVAAIAAESSTTAIDLDAARARKQRASGPALPIPRWLGAVAAVAIVVAGGAFVIRALDSDPTETAGAARATLAGTELAPGATATADIEATPAGLRILLDVSGLPGADDGEMYEAWVSDGTIRVSAGSFHLRQGDGPIALWAGVADPSFHLLSVTREPVDGVAESSGQVVLKGEFALDASGR